ncbi:MAG: CPXCG motif-containing cysteine-rich protein [Bacteroidota bacterium]
MEQHFFQCPYCWEEISMLLDPSVSATYIEDCEVCCNPLQITTQFEQRQLQFFTAENIEQ